jgi:signal transduction histidine kinase
MNIFTISLMTTAVLSLSLGFLVYLRNRTGLINKTWFAVTISITVWAIGFIGVVMSNNAPAALRWQHVLDIGSVFIPATFFHFVAVLLERHKNVKKRYLLEYRAVYIVAVAICLLIFSPLFKGGMVPVFTFPYWINPGPLYFIYPLFFSVTTVYFLFLLAGAYRRSFGIKRGQIKYVMVAIVIGFGGGLTNFFPQLFKIYPFGQYFVAFYVLFITYAISRYRLMDIKTLIKRSSVFALLVVIIGALFVLLSNLATQILDGWLGLAIWWIEPLIVSVIIASIFQPLRNLLENITNRFLYAKVYNSSELISEINSVTSSLVNLNRLLTLVAKILGRAFGCPNISIALLDQKKNLDVFYHQGFSKKTLTDLVKNRSNIMADYFSKYKTDIKIIEELKVKHESGDYHPKNTELLYSLYDMDAALIAPLFVKNKLIGVMVLGNKKSGDSYTPEDLRVLDIITGQVAIAIDNAQLYEEQKNFSVKLQGEVKKATKELKTVNKELKRLDQSKSEFLSIASHQLRTPLTIIKGYTSMMMEGSFGKVPKKINTNIGKVFIATERLIGLVESLLNVSRIEQGRIEFDIRPVNLVEIVAPLIEGFESKAVSKKLKLSFSPEENIPKVLADPQKVQEVISNIIDNSVKYTEKGEIIVGMHLEGQSVVFTCQDTGIGVEPEDLPRLFEKFVRGKGMMQVYTEGTGLGMYFARMVVENMGGRIWAESPGKGKGSKFSFSLPLANKKEAKKV